MKVGLLERLKLYAAVYGIGLPVHLAFRFLVDSQRVVLRGLDSLPQLGKQPLIIAMNHPWLLEIFFGPALFGRQYLRNPNLTPYSVPDAKNFGAWYWRWLRCRAIMVPRGERGRLSQTVLQMRRVLRENGTLVHFVEGGRTTSGTVWMSNYYGDKLRPVSPSLALLVKKTGALVYPIWTSGTPETLPQDTKKLFHLPNFFKGKVTLTGGSLLEFSKVDACETITDAVARTLLDLAASTHKSS